MSQQENWKFNTNATCKWSICSCVVIARDLTVGKKYEKEVKVSRLEMKAQYDDRTFGGAKYVHMIEHREE